MKRFPSTAAGEVGRVRIRPVCASRMRRRRSLYWDNRAHPAPFQPIRDEDFFPAAGQAARLASLPKEHRHGRGYPYLGEADGEPAGRITVTSVTRGPFCSGSLGYWVAAAHTGRGVATEQFARSSTVASSGTAYTTTAPFRSSMARAPAR